MPLQPDTNMQHQETNFVFADDIRSVFPPARHRRQRHVIGHRIVLFNVVEQRVRNVYLIPHPGDHGFDMGKQISVQLLIGQ
ncbi:hypothetical protein D3C75_722680 [compost metagenome]